MRLSGMVSIIALRNASDVAAIIAELSKRFPGVPGIDEDILAFLEVAHAQFWIELH